MGSGGAGRRASWRLWRSADSSLPSLPLSPPLSLPPLSLPARLVAGTEAPSCVIFLGMLVSALVLSALRAYMVTSSLSNAHEMHSTALARGALTQ